MTYARPHFRRRRPRFRVCLRLARLTKTQMSNESSTGIEMKTQRKPSSTERRERPNEIKVAFAERELTQTIRLLVKAACAAHGGAERMRLSDWCEVETEVTRKLAHGTAAPPATDLRLSHADERCSPATPPFWPSSNLREHVWEHY
jgi:ribosomal protein L28